MEILFIGIIIVALMIYASTKIKKSAAEAFEAEAIETEEFSLTKPAGYLHPLRDDAVFAFEAYTKDFGDDESKNFRRSRATVRAISNSDFESVRQNAKKTADRIISKHFVGNAPDGQKIFLLETEKSEKDVKFFTFWKIVESRPRRKVYEFQVSVLEEYGEGLTEAAKQMAESFSVK